MVIPVQTGIQYVQLLIDSHFRGNDRKDAFFKGLVIGRPLTINFFHKWRRYGTRW